MCLFVVAFLLFKADVNSSRKLVAEPTEASEFNHLASSSELQQETIAFQDETNNEVVGVIQQGE